MIYVQPIFFSRFRIISSGTALFSSPLDRVLSSQHNLHFVEHGIPGLFLSILRQNLCEFECHIIYGRLSILDSEKEIV